MINSIPDKCLQGFAVWLDAEWKWIVADVVPETDDRPVRCGQIVAAVKVSEVGFFGSFEYHEQFFRNPGFGIEYRSLDHHAMVDREDPGPAKVLDASSLGFRNQRHDRRSATALPR